MKSRLLIRMLLIAAFMPFTPFTPFTLPAAAADTVDDDASWRAVQHGAIVLLRHATAPGIGDPPGFRLGDCSTQRNLDATGEAEAKRIGAAFGARRVRVGAVLSSEWCRTHRTAELAFPGQVRDEPVFNSFFDNPSDDRLQTAKARALLLKWKGPGALIVVTHQVNITALTQVVPGSAEGVVLETDGKSLTIVGRFAPAQRQSIQ